MAPPKSPQPPGPLDQVALSVHSEAEAPARGVSGWSLALTAFALGAAAVGLSGPFAGALQAAPVQASRDLASAQPTDSPSAAEVRGYYRDILGQVTRAQERFQKDTAELARYRAMDYAGGDFEVLENLPDGAQVRIRRAGEVLSIKAGDRTLTDSPQGLSVETPVARSVRYRSGDFEVTQGRRGYEERIRLDRQGVLHYETGSREGAGFQETFELPEITVAVYPGPSLLYRFRPFQNGQSLGTREVTVYQDGSSQIRLLQPGSDPQVRFEPGWRR